MPDYTGLSIGKITRLNPISWKMPLKIGFQLREIVGKMRDGRTPMRQREIEGLFRPSRIVSYVCMLCESDVCPSRFDPLQVGFVYTDLPISRG